MIERIVENWLTSSTERVYEIPFCQLLVIKDYRLIHKTTHGPTEQGKDIIARDPKGAPCAFQLKTGDINTRKWREIYGEITELIELAIEHPSIEPSERHRAILVTNGQLSDDVRTKITNLNAANRKRSLPRLEVVVGSELLTDFLTYFGKYLPTSPESFSDFLNLYLGDGCENLSEEALAHFLERFLLGVAPKHLSIRAKRELIASALVMTTYALKPHSDKRNYLAIAKGYGVYSSYVLATASRLKIARKDWITSLDLSWLAIDRASRDLKAETLEKGEMLFEGDPFGDGGLVYRARNTLLLGWLSGLEIARKIKDSSYVLDPSLVSLIKTQNALFFGEYATIYFVMMSFYLELAGEPSSGREILRTAMSALSRQNCLRHKDLRPMSDPYFRPEAVIDNLYGIVDPRNSAELIDFESFRGCSYTVTTLVSALVRRNDRTAVASVWRDLSYLQHAQFVPEPKWEAYLWRSHRGIERNTAFPMTGSWTELERSSSAKPKELPPLLKQLPWFSAILMLTYPHRTNPELLKLVDHTFDSSTQH